jgi:UDPglucose 6-dehydrogenase
MESARGPFPDGCFCGSAVQATERADALIIATEWEEFKELDWEAVRGVMTQPLLLDGRNLLDAKQMIALGFEYHGVGRAIERRSVPHASQAT